MYINCELSNPRLGYFFGGFGGLLFIAGIVCIICYEPLGAPAPDASNLALGVVLFLVITIQAVFNAWQDWVYPPKHVNKSEQFPNHGKHNQYDPCRVPCSSRGPTETDSCH